MTDEAAVVRCMLCNPPQTVVDGDWADHVREAHPGTYAEFKRWPDGELVIVRSEMEPGDFER